MNRDYGARPKFSRDLASSITSSPWDQIIYHRTVVRMCVTPRVYKIGHAIIGTTTTTDKKGVVIFRRFPADRDFGTYHMLFLGVKLP